MLMNICEKLGNPLGDVVPSEDWDFIREYSLRAIANGGIEWCRERGCEENTPIEIYWLLIVARETRDYYRRQIELIGRI